MKYLLSILLLVSFQAFADVRVTITRDTPTERQTIIQDFPDKDAWMMWMELKMEEGCDPYVTKVDIDLNYIPEYE